jgi:hypothetical protein
MKGWLPPSPMVNIIQDYEEVENSESARTMQAIQRLKEIAAT